MTLTPLEKNHRYNNCEKRGNEKVESKKCEKCNNETHLEDHKKRCHNKGEHPLSENVSFTDCDCSIHNVKITVRTLISWRNISSDE